MHSPVLQRQDGGDPQEDDVGQQDEHAPARQYMCGGTCTVQGVKKHTEDGVGTQGEHAPVKHAPTSVRSGSLCWWVSGSEEEGRTTR